MNNHARIVPEIKENGPLLQVPPVVLALVAILLIIYAGLTLAGENVMIWAIYMFSFIPARLSGAVPYPTPEGAQVYTFLTYAFLHGSWGHVILNSIWLLVFGTITARRLTWLKFLSLSALCAFAGAVAMLLSFWGRDIIVIGASAAVSGMMGAAIPIMFGHKLAIPNSSGGLSIFLEPLRPRELISNQRALIFIIASLVLSALPALGGMMPNSLGGENAIAWQSHIAGFFMGIISFYWLDRIKGLPHPKS